MKFILNRQELDREKSSIIAKIRKGAIFIYPTDTIYGIGCNALNKKAVARIRKIKKRDSSPFSVIAPSKKWVRENCTISKDAEPWIKKLPGPYTLILKIKKGGVAKNVAPGVDTLGVRIPSNWFGTLVKEIGTPIVTTSANVSGKKFMTSLDNLDEAIKEGVDFIIYEGKKKGKPSKIIELTGKIRIIKR